ncbi:MAG: hypothetical protein M1834_003691 [Cirrosporium novae-zelandiae]|nr:MAG: hypothetical protein M1834_003691 [Cirrosporium novae-zelandiae]
MAEVAGLVLGAVGLISLCESCINCIDIIMTTRKLDQNYEVLCADLSLQRERFRTWGESVGLMPAGEYYPKSTVANHPGLKNPAARDAIGQALRAVEALLTNAHNIQKVYNKSTDKKKLKRPPISLKIHVRTRTSTLLNRSHSHQRQPLFVRLKWAIFAEPEFKANLKRLKGLIDNLENLARLWNLYKIHQRRKPILLMKGIAKKGLGLLSITF